MAVSTTLTPTTPTLRTCARCGKSKPLDKFYFRNKKKGLLDSYCKRCRSAMRSEYYHQKSASVQYDHFPFFESTRQAYKTMVALSGLFVCRKCGKVKSISQSHSNVLCKDCYNQHYNNSRKLDSKRKQKKAVRHHNYLMDNQERTRDYNQAYQMSLTKSSPHKLKKYNTIRLKKRRIKLEQDTDYRDKFNEYSRVYKSCRKEGLSVKQCASCGHYFPATSEYFVVDKESRDGFFALCKDCSQSKRRLHRYLIEMDVGL